MIEDDVLVKSWIKAILAGDTRFEKKLYEHYYNYGLTICTHYAYNKAEVKEILNDGFLKAFTNLDTFDFQKPFKF